MKLSLAISALLLSSLGLAAKKPCGGLRGLPCPEGYKCVDDPSDDCDPENGGADCMGICRVDKKPIACGGIRGLPCPEGYKCVDKPGDNCDPKHGGADCIGICRPDHRPKPCGGLKGIKCPQGYKCIDKPNDGCDPKKGDKDCIGICVRRDPLRRSITKRVEVIETRASGKCKHKTICVNRVNQCGKSYGGCYDTCTGTTFTKPPCPNGPKPCKHASLCVDYLNDCNQTFGGCFDTCTAKTFTAPPCPKAFHRACGGFVSPKPPRSCPTGYKCVDKPGDGCDPKHGGADCPSWCVPARTA